MRLPGGKIPPMPDQRPIQPSRLFLRLAAIFGFLGVALGAFGAHGLKQVLASHGGEAWWQTAVLYHLVHAVAAWVAASAGRCLPAALFLGGTAIFSGTLYLMGMTGWRWLGAITPIGGTLFLIGWLLLVIRPSAS